jgi:hypothetical protein
LCWLFNFARNEERRKKKEENDSNRRMDHAANVRNQKKRKESHVLFYSTANLLLETVKTKNKMQAGQAKTRDKSPSLIYYVGTKQETNFVIPNYHCN